MVTYKNIGGNSGVVAYEFGADYIKVQFSTGKSYLYNYDSAGPETVEHMKVLAQNGQGLNTFINKHVKMFYVK